MTLLSDGGYRFAPEERPLFPGSPFSPSHSLGRRLAYAATAVVVGISSTFGNGLVTVNAPNLGGALGLYAVQVSWLPAIYVAMNATANLSLIKARAQFGIPQVTHVLLALYALAGLLQLAFPGFAASVAIRAIDGMTAAGLTTLTIYYLLQVFPPKIRPLAIVLGISLPQLGPALARLVPVEMLALDHWRGLHLIELGLALGIQALITAVPLPPSERSKAFEPLDLLTIGLVMPAMLLVCGVLGVGRLLWWTDTPWLGWALAAAVPLFTAAALIEHFRTRPLLQTRWIASVDIVRFLVVAVVVRLALAEQTYGAIGLLTIGGLTNDQLHPLFVIVALSMVAGAAVAAATASEKHLRHQVMAASLFIAWGAWIDTSSTNLTRPAELYFSQALIGFGTTLFIGPALLFGFIRMLKRGPAYLVSLIVVFSSSQNVGGLAGSALLGSLQTIWSKAHALALSEHLTAGDPQTAARIAAGAAAISGAVVDPAAQAGQGAGLLSQALTREANILAYNDVFRLVMTLALVTAGYLALRILYDAVAARRLAQTEAHA